jgi:transketolase
VGIALAAADRMAANGIEAAVVSFPMVRPIDRAALFDLARSVRALVVTEEHSVHGGLGEACASALMSEGIPVPFRGLGIPDEPIVNGPQLAVLAHYGIDAERIAALVEELLG